MDDNKFELLVSGGTSPAVSGTTAHSPAAIIALATACGANVWKVGGQRFVAGKKLWVCADESDYAGGTGLVVYTGRWNERQVADLRLKCDCHGAIMASGEEFLSMARSGALTASPDAAERPQP